MTPGVENMSTPKRKTTALLPREALRASEAKYRKIIEASLDGIMIVDLGTKMFGDVNPAICRMFGYPAEEFLTLSLADILPQFVQAVVMDKFVSLPLGEVVRLPATACLRKDGTTFYADINAAKMRADGRECLCGQFRDIAERRRADEDVRESEKRYRTIVESIGDALFIHDVEGNILEVNDAACQLYGYAREELVGNNLRRFVLPGTEADAAERLKRLSKEGRLRFENISVRKDGTRVATDVFSKMVSREGRGIVHGFVRDISELKRAQEALRSSEARYRSLFDASSDGILCLDVESGKFTYANPAICRMLGYTLGEIVTLGMADIHTKESLPGIAERFAARARGETTQVRKTPCRRKDGTIFYSDVLATKVTLGGRECHWGQFRDISKRG